MAIILDLQGFKIPNKRFELKELGAIYLNTDGESSEQLTRLTFSSSCPLLDLPEEYQKHNKWLERNRHGIPWEEGDIDSNDVDDAIDIILKNVKCVYVMGSKKKNWLSTKIDSSQRIINLEDLGCPSLMKLHEEPSIYHSIHHSKCVNYVCAYENVQRLKKWFVKELGLFPSVNKSVRLFCVAHGLSGMMTEDIELLPTELIIKFNKNYIAWNWEKLSAQQRRNGRIAGYAICPGHLCDSCDGDCCCDVVEGCKYRKDCSICKKDIM